MSDIRPPARFGIGAGAAARPAWNHRAERGSARLTRLMIWLVLHLGWRTGRALLYPIALYYLLAAKGPRGASARFLRRALGRPVRLRDLYRHVFAFAAMLLDRVFFLTGRTEDFTLSVHGLAHLEAAIAAGRGAVLLGGHLGSFEALRAFGRQSPVPVRMLMYRANRGAFTAAIERLDPGFARSVIEIGTPESMLRVSEAIGRGELVGILADRAPEPGAGGAPAAAASRRVRTRFLGGEAGFPAGPFLLAAAVRAPVLLFFGVCTGPRRYELRFEPLAAALDVPPSERAAAVDRAVACYACRLAELARAHPFQWFNFYDLWDSSSRGAASSDRPPRRRRRRKIPAGDRTWDADADIRPAATVAVVRPAAVAGPGPGC